MYSLSVPNDKHQGRLVPVKFRGDTVEVTVSNGELWVNVCRICESVGTDPEGQRQRLNRSPWATTCITQAVAADGRLREVYCIHIDKLPMWLATIEASCVAEHAREKLVAYQCECADALKRYFFEGQAINPRLKRRLRYERQGKDQLWIEDRERGVEVRKDFTSVLKAHGVTKRGYGIVTNAVYRPILGGGAQDAKRQLGLGKSANLRDSLPRKQLLMVSLSEVVSQERIDSENRQGDNSCRDAAFQTAAAIAGAVRALPAS